MNARLLFEARTGHRQFNLTKGDLELIIDALEALNPDNEVADARCHELANAFRVAHGCDNSTHH